ncbi:MAG TPA: TadE/TadG family type IV pilus assembly protein [Acidimicrobiales bacterium]|nr:TadE/TadG family type IV pilus assembly protein [Acidimicrobiales bacterium]
MEEFGAAAVEAVIIVPLAMILVLFAVQAGIWAHAATEVEAAAVEGVRVAALSGGQAEPGIRSAQQFLARDAGTIVQAPSVSAAALPGDRVELRVSATAESIVPWIALPLSADRVGTIQEFRSDG